MNVMEGSGAEGSEDGEVGEEREETVEGGVSRAFLQDAIASAREEGGAIS